MIPQFIIHQIIQEICTNFNMVGKSILAESIKILQRAEDDELFNQHCKYRKVIG